MSKRILIAIFLVYIVMTGLDFVIHQLILGSAYEATMQLWRPMEEMKMGLMQIVNLIVAASFVLIYALWIKKHSPMAGLKFGLLFGFTWGVSMGYGSYSVMPIPYMIAATWCWGTVVKMAVAGLIAGLIVRQPAAA